MSYYPAAGSASGSSGGARRASAGARRASARGARFNFSTAADRLAVANMHEAIDLSLDQRLQTLAGLLGTSTTDDQSLPVPASAEERVPLPESHKLAIHTLTEQEEPVGSGRAGARGEPVSYHQRYAIEEQTLRCVTGLVQRIRDAAEFADREYRTYTESLPLPSPMAQSWNSVQQTQQLDLLKARVSDEHTLIQRVLTVLTFESEHEFKMMVTQHALEAERESILELHAAKQIANDEHRALFPDKVTYDAVKAKTLTVVFSSPEVRRHALCIASVS